MASFAHPPQVVADVLIILVTICGLGFPCIMLWAGDGTVLKQAITRADLRRSFNLTMAAVLVASMVPKLVEIARAI